MDISKLSLQGKRKIEDAEKSYQKMWENIKPFIKERKLKQYSTAGKWVISDNES